MKVECSYRIAVGVFVVMATLPYISYANDGVLGRVEALERTIAVLERAITTRFRFRTCRRGQLQPTQARQFRLDGWLRTVVTSSVPITQSSSRQSIPHMVWQKEARSFDCRSCAGILFAALGGNGRATAMEPANSARFKGRRHAGIGIIFTCEARQPMLRGTCTTTSGVRVREFRAGKTCPRRSSFDTTKFAVHHRDKGKDSKLNDFHLHTHSVDIRGNTEREGAANRDRTISHFSTSSSTRSRVHSQACAFTTVLFQSY